jgi:hypothetical protein
LRKPVMAEAPGAMRSPGSTSVSNSSTCSSSRIRTAPISQIADVPGRSPVVSRSTTTYVAARGEALPRAAARARPCRRSRRGARRLPRPR